ncbi:uncharacterized protein LOC8075362 [Sorghum bicolor]|uniref:NAD-dependent epimerase/dehydratase domain-containing protein n=1 Tax=Sorghum bicolor TaxID=4558 RepID=A0A1B6Q3J5_SORBI|nr:uncharacterized protein LOC8075362 [Sorghum bicolor]KXG32499.1 hypothetical protein SORBI_3003G162900 [Sorghum bicolor]|eukprot:XP_002457833.2 uncharacterized protein LOC8075362 [Sorghum bicolor]
MGGAARVLPRPIAHHHFHQSASLPYLHAAAPVAASSALFAPRPTPSPSVRVSRPRRHAAMSAAAADSSSSSSIGIPRDAAVSSLSPESVSNNDLLIVGPGVLGRIVAEMWKQEYPGCKVCGQTATTDHHSELTDIGIIPSLKRSVAGPKFPNVIFCAPPYRSEDYAGDLRIAASNWNGEGSFLFTSSTAVYDCSDNGFCGEDSPCVSIGQSPRTDVLLKAENVVLEAGGCVLRLAGLYKSDRGPHVYWLSKGTLDVRPDHILNLIHYEDAASLAIAIMKKRLRSRIFVGCDNEPLSRLEIMDRVNRSGKFETQFQGFTGTDGPLGKRMENSKTRAELGWQPKYPSFTEFLGLSNL